MGIKHFFMWFKQNYSEYMTPLKLNEKVEIHIDNLMIDMNGLFHNSAQKIYKYGNHKAHKRLLQRRKNTFRRLQQQIDVFKDVCNSIEKLFEISRPQKRLILCVDGPAPLSKQCQQRQRRFRSAMESSTHAVFDSNSITPGTKFMDYLSKYIDWYIRKRISESSDWQKIEIIFSNEKVAGEGEYKAMQYVRYYGNMDETFCINGLDADLIMLALSTRVQNFYILREDLYDPANEYFCIDIGNVRKVLSKKIEWKSKKYQYNPRSGIDDFVFLCFMVGNDFLPHIPSIEIIEGGIELLLNLYKDVCSSYGHLTKILDDGSIQFRVSSTKIFLTTIGNHEKDNYEEKLKRRKCYFEDKILDCCSTQQKTNWIVDIEKYNKLYMLKHFGENPDIQKICHDYLEGMQWVLTYYTCKVPNWKWLFKYHYAPPASILAKYIDSFTFSSYGITFPSTPFQQLMSVLPPKSAHLIPAPLCNYILDKDSPLAKYCPKEISIDLSGKRREWEGILMLPIVDFDLVRKCYFKDLDNVNPRDSKRNITGKTFIYQYNSQYQRLFKSYYGNINKCCVEIKKLNL